MGSGEYAQSRAAVLQAIQNAVKRLSKAAARMEHGAGAPAFGVDRAAIQKRRTDVASDNHWWQLDPNMDSPEPVC